MATRKTAADPDDVIEGVAVEKEDQQADKAGKKTRSGGARGTSKQGTGAQAPGSHSSESNSPENSSSGRKLSGRWFSFTLLVGVLIIALAGALYMLQSRNSQQDILQARLSDIEAQIAAQRMDLSTQLATEMATEMAAARDEDAAARRPLQDNQQTLMAQVAALTGRVDQLDGQVSPDFAMRLDAMADRLAALENNLETSLETPSNTAGNASDGNASAFLSDIDRVSDLILAQTGLATLAGMLADNSAGGDLQRWLPNLHALESAGLELGDLDALAAAAAARPPSTMQLLAAGRDLAVTLTANTSPPGDTGKTQDSGAIKDSGTTDGTGWWSSITSGLSSFVRIRDVDSVSGAASGSESGGDGNTEPTPLQNFRMAAAAGQLAEAVAVSHSLDASLQTGPQMDQWRDAVAARLHIDGALTNLAVQLTASLANSLQTLKDGSVLNEGLAPNSNSGLDNRQPALAEDQ